MTAFLALVAFCSPMAAIFLSILLFPHGRKPLSCALGIGFAAAVGFYYLRTGLDADIVRHMEYLSFYKGLGFLQCFDAGHYQTLYVWDAWNWLIAQIGDPYLLQASAAFVNYSIISYIVFDAARGSSASQSKTALYWLIAISAISPMALVVGIRSGTSCMVAALALYRGYAKSRSCFETLALLLVSILIHHSALLFLMAWLLAPLCQKQPLKVCAIVFAAFLGIAAVSTVLLTYFPAGGNPLNSFVHSVLAGVVDTAEGDEWSTTHAGSFNTKVNTLWSLFLIASFGLSIWKKTEKSGRFEGGFGAVLAAAAVISACSAALMIVFPINGGRPLPVVCLLAISCLLHYGCQVSSAGAMRYDLFDALVIAASAGEFLLHAYSLMYGGTEVWSLLAGFLMGFFTSIL